MPESGLGQAIAALERAARFGVNPSLEAMERLCEALGDPQHAVPSVQVTGSNGKTSVTRMTAALLAAHGLRTGCYTSPHLHSLTERVIVDGVPVGAEAFSAAVMTAVEAAGPEGATQFEILTAAGFLLLRDAGVEASVLEVGMGGRWDATSVARPLVSVLTGVGLEHTEHLGPTVWHIAREKAAIIRPGGTAVLGPGTIETQAVFAGRASEVGAAVVTVREDRGDARWAVLDRPSRPGGGTLVRIEGNRGTDVTVRVRGPAYQAPNAAVAIAAAEAFLGRALSPDSTATALGAMRFPARFETLREAPPLVVDGAHNPQGAATLARAVADAWPGSKPTVLLGVLDDKDAEGIVMALAPVAAAFVCSRSASDRALSPERLAGVVEGVTGERPEVFADLEAALGRATGLGGEAGVLVTGSLTMAADVRRLTGWDREGF